MLPSCFFFYSLSLGLGGHGGPEMSQPPLMKRRSPEDTTDSPGSPVTDTSVNVMKRFPRDSIKKCKSNVFVHQMGEFGALNTQMPFYFLSPLCLWSGACGRPWSHKSSCYDSAQWQRTENTEASLSRQHGYRRQKGRCVRTHTHTHTYAVTRSVCQWQLRLALGGSIKEQIQEKEMLSLYLTLQDLHFGGTGISGFVQFGADPIKNQHRAVSYLLPICFANIFWRKC